MMRRLEEEKKEAVPFIYAPRVKEKKENSFVDGLLTVIDIIIFTALIASYLIVFDMSGSFSIKEITFNTLWFAAGTVSVGMLTKKIARNKGRSTQEYTEADKKANEALKKLGDSEYAGQVPRYCENYTERVIKRTRTQYLSVVGLTVQDYTERFIGLENRELRGLIKNGEINRKQYKAIRKCDKVNIKPYDPNFILSFKSEIDCGKSPSEMYNTEREDKLDTAKSILTTLVSSVFVCSLVSDVVLNLSKEVIVAAVIKIITMLIYIAFKTSFGWNISRKEIKRNELRASEAEACEKWCRENPPKVTEEAEAAK
jgi:hypothetical protein